MANQRVDRQVKQALKSLLDMSRGNQRQSTLQTVAESRTRNGQPPQHGLNQAHTDKATQLGFVRAQGRDRSHAAIGDMVAQRSDAIPGRYSCVECGTVLTSLQEAWRDASGSCSNFSTLFCQPCAMRVRSMTLGMTSAPNLAPIQLSPMDQLNMGQFVPSFGVIEAAPSAKPQGLTPAEIWRSMIKGDDDNE